MLANAGQVTPIVISMQYIELDDHHVILRQLTSSEWKEEEEANNQCLIPLSPCCTPLVGAGSLSSASAGYKIFAATLAGAVRQVGDFQTYYDERPKHAELFRNYTEDFGYLTCNVSCQARSRIRTLWLPSARSNQLSQLSNGKDALDLQQIVV
uniref:Uncharacterized protein n=1 Tax=Romanomermis culicivorax TaxID=13658 RepID=A0A915L2K6_ROMCU